MRRRTNGPVVKSLAAAGLFATAWAGLAAAQSLEPTSAETSRLLPQMRAAYTGEFAYRTENFGPDGTTPAFLNRLVLEDSPYLQQHAHNPVDWRPWNAETLAQARAENKPIFLSIGYATCHWCHVMEHESFDNPAIANELNERFISVKVDREQNPDVDLLYMTALQLSADSAGWPLTGFLMPNGKPFFVASYLRPDGFSTIINQVNNYWDNDRFELVLFSEQLSNSVKGYMTAQRDAATLGQTDIDRAAVFLLGTTDPENGGYGRAPKFPHETEMVWLLDVFEAKYNADIERSIRLSLDGMQEGGIHDQVGGGFHRYAVDNRWTIPHFEKMLYNQAQLLQVYARASAAFGEPSYAHTAERIVEFVLRDMTSADGLFMSGFDADSGGREGPFYLWTEKHIRDVLTPSEAAWALEALGVDDNLPNFEGESLPTFRAGTDMRTDILRKLEVARRDREWPLLDNKRISAWNAEMIEALVIAGQAMDRPEWITQAVRSGERLWTHHANPTTGYLARFSTDKKISETAAVLADYAYTVKAFVRLFDATGDKGWLGRAERVSTYMHGAFWNEELRLYTEAETGNNQLFATPVSTNDNARFSGAGSAALAMVELGRRLEDPRLELRAAEALIELSGRAAAAPTSHGSVWRTVQRRLNPGEAVDGVAVTAAGTVRSWIDRGELVLSIADGWHINSFTPQQDYLIGTQISYEGQAAEAVTGRPVAKLTRLAFSDQPLETYEGDLRFGLKPRPSGEQARLSLQIQACDDRRCLPPETLSLALPRR